MSTVVTSKPSEEIVRLARDLRRLGGDTSRELNKTYKGFASTVAGTAKRNASWSSRIPAAIKVKTARSLVHPGADIVVSGPPHARLYEGFAAGRNGGRKKFRHLVFHKPPKRKVWVSQATRPFIRPAAGQHRDAGKKEVDAAVIAAARAQGWT